MRRGGLRIAVLMSGLAVPILLATTSGIGAGAATLPEVPVTVPTVTVPTTVPTLPTVTVPSVTVPELPTVTVPSVTVPELPTVTVPSVTTAPVPPVIPNGATSPTPGDAARADVPDLPAAASASPAGTSGPATPARSHTPAAHHPPTLLAATRQAAAPFALPLAAMLLLAAWLVVRGMHDRRDVRLAAAPVADRWIGFR